MTTTKRKPGRPRGRIQNARLDMLLPAELKADIERAAALAGLSPSEWIRQALQQAILVLGHN